MKKGFVVSAVLYPLLVIALALIMGVISMSDNRRKILDNMKLEVSEESETDPEMTNSNLYYKIKSLEEAYGELSSKFSEEYFDQIKADYEAKIATAKSQAKLEAFPVGSIFTSTTSTNPSSYIGGTWQAYGQGRTLIGVGNNGAANYSLGSTGGSEAHTHTVGGSSLTTKQLPSHTHSIPALTGNTSTSGEHTHNFVHNSNSGYKGWAHSSSSGNYVNLWAGSLNSLATSAPLTSIANAGNHSHTITTVASTTGSIGSGESHTHTLTTTSSHSPYIVVYFWKRTA